MASFFSNHILPAYVLPSRKVVFEAASGSYAGSRTSFGITATPSLPVSHSGVIVSNNLARALDSWRQRFDCGQHENVSHP
jgi:hypothetical protein